MVRAVLEPIVEPRGAAEKWSSPRVSVAAARATAARAAARAAAARAVAVRAKPGNRAGSWFPKKNYPQPWSRVILNPGQIEVIKT